MAKLIRKGIFYLIKGEEALRLASLLGIKLIEKKITHLDGQIDVEVSCGFPESGLDKYIGKLVRIGENVEVIVDGKVIEEIEIVKRETKYG